MTIHCDFQPIFDNMGKVIGYIATARVPRGINKAEKIKIEELLRDKAVHECGDSPITNTFSDIEGDTARIVVLTRMESSLPSAGSTFTITIQE